MPGPLGDPCFFQFLWRVWGQQWGGMRNPWHEEPISCLQTSQPTLETFQDLLHRHPDAFYLARTAKSLQAHWQLMKQYYLLEDQTGNTPGAAA